MAETTSAPSLREWVLVPRVPTTEMRRAMARACTLGWDIGDYTWEQGLAAAPTPPTTLSEAIASALAEGIREGLERAALEAERAGRIWQADGRSYALTIAAIIRDTPPTAARAEGWQPIKTAPHGRPILIGRWTKPEAGRPAWDAQVFIIESPNWREDFDWIDDEPTHWCEMVAPPTTPGGRTDG